MNRYNFTTSTPKPKIRFFIKSGCRVKYKPDLKVDKIGDLDALEHRLHGTVKSFSGQLATVQWDGLEDASIEYVGNLMDV